jgi:hypothetical protein
MIQNNFGEKNASKLNLGKRHYRSYNFDNIRRRICNYGATYINDVDEHAQ